MVNSRIEFDTIADLWSYGFVFVGAACLEGAVAIAVAVAIVVCVARNLRLGCSLGKSLPILVAPVAAQWTIALAIFGASALILTLQGFGLTRTTSAVIVIEAGLFGLSILGITLYLYGKRHSDGAREQGTNLLDKSTAQLCGVLIFSIIFGVFFILLFAISAFCERSYYPYFILSIVAILLSTSSVFLIFIHFLIDENEYARKDFHAWLDFTLGKASI